MSEKATELTLDECSLVSGGGQTISTSGGKTEEDTGDGGGSISTSGG